MQISGAIASGAAGLLTIQKLVAKVRSVPVDKPVDRSERKVISRQLAEIRDFVASQNRAVGDIDGRLAAIDDRLSALEQTVSYMQGRSRSGSTD